VSVYAVWNCSPGFPASEIVFAEDNSFLRKELLVLELFYKERINMVFFKVLLPFEYHDDFRLMTMILQEQWLSVRCILFNSYKEFTEHYEVREEALVQKKHKPGRVSKLYSCRVLLHTTVAPKLKRLFSSPFACEIFWRSFLHLLCMFYFSHKLICFYKFDCSHHQVFPEVCALMEMLAVNCPHTCDVERANSLVKLFKDESSDRLTLQSLFHKLLMSCMALISAVLMKATFPKELLAFVILS